MSVRHSVVIAVTVTLMLAGLTLRPTRAAVADAVLEAKRKAAAQLLKDGRPADALSLLAEVTAADDDSFYGDHLLIARAHDKLGHAAEALRHYKRVMELASPNAQGSDERQARQEADKRIRQLDPQGGKIDTAVDDYLRKLDSLEREAVSARSMIALERIFRLRGLTWQAERLPDHGYAEVSAAAAWQPAGLEVKAGRTYHVRAAGTWCVKGNSRNPQIECTAAGTNQRKLSEFPFVCGSLEGGVNGKFFQLGEDATFTAPASGPLMLIEAEADTAARAHNSGALQILIWVQ